MLTPETIKQWLMQGMPEAEIQITGDGHHFEAMIISQIFAGKTLLQRQRIVYAALGEKMQQIHALSMKTLTPDEVK